MSGSIGAGSGPAPIVAASGRALESAAQEAYRLYLDHRRTCPDCSTIHSICERGSSLWETFKAAREAAP